MKKILIVVLIVMITYGAKAQACLKNDSSKMELKVFDAGNNNNDKYVLFKGQPQKIKLKFIKENIKICNECSHPEVFTHYNEIIDDKLTGGMYVIHYMENLYELTYTRNSDKQNFVFTGSSKPEHCTW
jgi:hypothetical protein